MSFRCLPDDAEIADDCGAGHATRFSRQRTFHAARPAGAPATTQTNMNAIVSGKACGDFVVKTGIAPTRRPDAPPIRVACHHRVSLSDSARNSAGQPMIAVTIDAKTKPKTTAGRITLATNGRKSGPLNHMPGMTNNSSTTAAIVAQAATAAATKAPILSLRSDFAPVGMVSCLLQHTTPDLIRFDAFEQRAEVAFAEALIALALDQLEEDRADLVGGEDLQQ